MRMPVFVFVSSTIFCRNISNYVTGVRVANMPFVRPSNEASLQKLCQANHTPRIHLRDPNTRQKDYREKECGFE